MEKKTFNHSIEVKREEGKPLHITGYALAFGNVDSWGDIILPTACDKWLASEDAKRCALCYQHNFDEVIGVINSMSIDDYGLKFEADICDTTLGGDVIKLIEAGAVREFSIGYRADKYHYEKREGYDYDIRILEEISILEISPVTRAANPAAILLDAKGEEFEGELRKASDTDLEAMAEAIEQEQCRRAFEAINI